MSYKADDVRGHLQDAVTLVNEIGGEDLIQKIKSSLFEGISSGKIQANLKEDFFRSGSMLFGTKAPMIVLSNNNDHNRFFDIGICVNGKTVSFFLLGESVENTKNKKKQYYYENGSKLKASMIKVDVLKLQEESVWQQTIADYFNSLIEH